VNFPDQFWFSQANLECFALFATLASAYVIILLSIIALPFVYFVGYIIADGVRMKRSGPWTPQQLAHVAVEHRETEKQEWTLPPELNVPTPRPVRSASAGARLLRTLPQTLSLAALAIVVYAFAFTDTHAMPKQGGPEISLLVQRFLAFLHAPRWDHWMFWPSVVFGTVAGLVLLIGYFRRREEKQLLKWGIPTRAVVIRTWGNSRSGQNWELEYSDASGNTIKTRIVRSTLPQPGHEVFTILYDQSKPHRLVTYPVARYTVGAA
jgi:hypothetical protein